MPHNIGGLTLAINKIDIRPGVSILAVLRHLNYKPWFALAEFVDNSVQSYLVNRDALVKADGASYKLRVDIDIDSTPPARITIRDNAAGISVADFPRAFRPAVVPTDRSGLAEFGMGMKSASCWFSPKWKVRTSALGDPTARLVQFNIENIINDDIHELDVAEQSERAERHYTEVTLEDVFKFPIKRTVAKLKEHLADIYRVFIRDGVLDLRFNGEILSYQEVPILRAPYFKDEGDAILWKKEIVFDLGEGLSVTGFAAIRETANTAKAGFSLFRRGRVIQGSGDEGYRPQFIFGSSNSYRYQRLWGELHLNGFDVSHTKDGFRWDENEQPFLELLREHLDSDDMPLLRQAEGYRVRKSRGELKASAERAVENTSRAMETKLPDIIPAMESAPNTETPEAALEAEDALANREFVLRYKDKDWIIIVEITNDPSESQWLVLSDVAEVARQPRRIHLRISIAHPFMVRFAQGTAEELEAITRLAAAFGMAEVLARDAGVKYAGTVRRNVNEILAEALSGA